MELYKWIEKETQLGYHKLLHQRLEELKNPNTNTDLYVFGKLKIDFLYHIENYLLKELFIDNVKLQKLKLWVQDSSLFNFKIYPLVSLEPNDEVDLFFKDYNGLMGIKYY
jgi:hypothetical protein